MSSRKSTVERAFDAYCQMTPSERQDFQKLCEGYERGVAGPLNRAPKKRKPVEKMKDSPAA